MEDTSEGEVDGGGEEVSVMINASDTTAGKNVREVGSDMAAGEKVLKSGSEVSTGTVEW